MYKTMKSPSYLRLSARVSTATLCYLFKVGSDPVTQEYALKVDGKQVKEFKADYTLWQPGRDHIQDRMIVYCLYLARLNHNDVPHIECIVLRKIEPGTQKYERIGWMWDEEEKIRGSIQASETSMLTIIWQNSGKPIELHELVHNAHHWNVGNGILFRSLPTALAPIPDLRNFYVHTEQRPEYLMALS